MLQCFVLVCNRLRPSSTRTRPPSTHVGWRVKKNFPETFKSQLEKTKMLFTAYVGPYWEKLCPRSEYGLGRYSRPRAHTVSPNTDLPAGE